MKNITSVFIVIITSLLLGNCNTTIEQPEKSNIRISGSDSEALISNELLLAFNSAMTYPSFELKSIGTEAGITEFINGQCEIANASRRMTFNERKRAKANGIKPIEVIIAYDAVGIITNPKLGIDSLSIEDLKLIYTGKITNWKELGGPDLNIQCYGRSKGSGTREFIESTVLHRESLSSTISFTFTEEIVEAVENDLSAIGYVGVGYIMESEGKPLNTVWPMNIYSNEYPATSPWEKYKILRGEYPLCRPLLQYFKGYPTEKQMDFLQFELSQEGQEIINNTGYFSLTEEHKTINLRNGILLFQDSI
ncbi:MAG: PstS family phosphate ABC transporter substrate-binding protein [Crocinitomicaceae bacterium]|nr:PstS family phosphate ABC transporter substrate-binding protein [Crocinitomicaceae bacterium]